MGEKMMYDTILARSFSRYDQRKLGYGAFIGCLLALSCFTVFKPYLGPFPVLNMRLSIDATGLQMLRITDSSSSDTSSSSMRLIVNETSSSEIEMVVESETSSTNETMSNDNIISFNASLPVLNDTITIGSSNSTPVINDTISTNVITANDSLSSQTPEDMKPICYLKERTQFCEMNGDIRVNGKSSTVFMASDSSRAGTLLQNSSWIIGPYARRDDEEALNRVTKWSIKSWVDAYEAPQCDQRHKVPAIIFSLGGYAGNNFHDYTDIVLPLYLTSRQFHGEVKFLVTDIYPWWMDKFRHVLQKLSRYELVDIDKEANVHCFTSVIVGLKRYPKELKIDPSRSPYSMKDFRLFLRSAYSLKKENAIKMRDDDHNGGSGKRNSTSPRLLILSRKRTRAFTNTNEIARMARSLGYNVVVTEADSNVTRVAKMVNSCDVMMGVHGAGLTNMVFLPENAILIQVVPIGGFDWLAKTDFGEPSKDMNLRYIDYKIKTEESSLIQQYPRDHEVLNDPYAVQKRGWYEFKSIYLQKQNVNLDLNRFKATLLRALELLHQ